MHTIGSVKRATREHFGDTWFTVSEFYGFCEKSGIPAEFPLSLLRQYGYLDEDRDPVTGKYTYRLR